MKKSIISLAVLLLITATGFTQTKHDIRDVNWGWSLSQVKSSEKFELLNETADGLTYTGKLNNNKFDLMYSFIDHKLVRLSYINMEEHVNKNNYVKEYTDLKEILTKKYDTPLFDKTNWTNDLYKDDPDDIGLACSAGHVIFLSAWKTESTKVNLICAGENFKISIGIIYTSIKLAALINAATEEKNTKDF